MTVKFLVSDHLGRLKMTQKELADSTGIRPNTISNLYHDKATRIEVDHIEKLCKAFKCSVQELIKIEE